MKYYHGTDKYFKELRLPTEKSYKDFGVGVYLAETEIHARKVAFWKRGMHAYVYSYQVNITEIKKSFKVKVFNRVSIEWLKYIIKNRTEYTGYDYAAVIGPTADADAQEIIEKFIKDHTKPTLDDYKKLQDDLKTNVYKTQICIKSQQLLDIFNKSRIGETQLK